MDCHSNWVFKFSVLHLSLTFLALSFLPSPEEDALAETTRSFKTTDVFPLRGFPVGQSSLSCETGRAVAVARHQLGWMWLEPLMRRNPRRAFWLTGDTTVCAEHQRTRRNTPQRLNLTLQVPIMGCCEDSGCWASFTRPCFSQERLDWMILEVPPNPGFCASSVVDLCGV